MTRAIRFLLLAFLVLLACVTARTAFGPYVTVEVENQNWSDVVVYALCGTSTLKRIGPIPTNATERVDIPLGSCTDFRLGWRFIGGTHRLEVSDRLPVRDGSVIEITITNPSPFTYWRVAER